MKLSRRHFIGSSLAGLAGAAATALPKTAVARERHSHFLYRRLSKRIVETFEQLPGNKALKIWSPHSRDEKRSFSAALNEDAVLFCGSAIKVYILAEFLRQMEAGDASLAELLDVNDSVWSLSSSVLTPVPGTVTGKVTARTALEAMIAKSDNTATDMMLARAGADNVRAFLSQAQLNQTMIPDSTRKFFGYVMGAANWMNLSWEELLELAESDDPAANPLINNVQTMAASPADFVSFYSKALQGEYFQKPETLTVFRSILGLPDTISLIMPLGVNAFLKGGSIDLSPDHAMCIAGGMFVPRRRWIYYALMLNWTESNVPDTGAVIAEFVAALRNIFSWLQTEFETY